MDFSFINENDLKDIKPVNKSIDTQSVDASNDDSTDWDSYITKLASKYPDIPEKIVRGLIQRESAGDPYIDVDTETESGIARGLGQFIDETAKNYIPDWKGPADSYNPYKSIEGIYKYLTDLKDIHNGNLNLALQNYLGVIGKKDKFGTKTEDYAKQIEVLAESFPSFKKRIEPKTDFSFINENDLLDNQLIDSTDTQVTEQPQQIKEIQPSLPKEGNINFVGPPRPKEDIDPDTLYATPSKDYIKGSLKLLGKSYNEIIKLIHNLSFNKYIGSAAGLTPEEVQITKDATAQAIGLKDSQEFWTLNKEEEEAIANSGMPGRLASSTIVLVGTLPQYIAAGGGSGSLIKSTIEKIGKPVVEKALPFLVKKYGTDKVLGRIIGSIANTLGYTEVTGVQTGAEKGVKEAIKEVPKSLATGALMEFGGTLGRAFPKPVRPVTETIGSMAGMAAPVAIEGGSPEQIIESGIQGAILHIGGKVFEKKPIEEPIKETPTTVLEKSSKPDIKVVNELSKDDIDTALELYTNPDFKEQVKKEVSALADGEQKDYLMAEMSKIDQEELQSPSKSTETPQESKISSEPIQTTPKEESVVKEPLNVKSSITIRPEEITEEQWKKLTPEEKDEYYKQSQPLILNNPVTNVPGQRAHNREFNKLTDNQTKPTTVAIGDVNGLKELNDVLIGMTESDKLFGVIHKYVSEQFPEDGVVFHLHGDEFSVLSSLPKEEVQKRLKVAMEKFANDVSIEKDGVMYKPTMSWNVGEAKNHEEVGNLNPKSIGKNEIGLTSDNKTHSILKGSDNVSEENIIKRGIHAENIRRRELAKGSEQTSKEGQRDLAGETEGEIKNKKQQTKLEDNLTPKMKESLAKLEEEQTSIKKEKEKTASEKQREIIEKANKIRDLAKENPDFEFIPDEKNPNNTIKLGKIVEGKNHEYLAKLYDEAALKIENDITKKQTEKQKLKKEVLSTLSDVPQEYTPELEKKLIKVFSQEETSKKVGTKQVKTKLSENEKENIAKSRINKYFQIESVGISKEEQRRILKEGKEKGFTGKKLEQYQIEQLNNLPSKKTIRVKDEMLDDFERVKTGISTTKLDREVIDTGEPMVGKTDKPDIRIEEDFIDESIQMSKKQEPTLNYKDGGYKTEEQFNKHYEEKSLKQFNESKEEFLKRSFCTGLL